jgi:5'-3' exonuclease
MERDLIIDYEKTRRRRRMKCDSMTFADKLTFIPTTQREVEKYINPFEYGWESRYYDKLFEVDNTERRVNQIGVNYLEGIEWVWKYYNGECHDWLWKYKYNYPPLLNDLMKVVPYFDTKFITNNRGPVTKEVQLSYVLPREKLYLLNPMARNRLLNRHGDLYPSEYKYEWAYCKYFWEAHIDLPEIDVELLSI